MPKLIVLQDGKKKVYNLTRDVTTLGRSKEAHVPLLDSRASRNHARIVRSGDDYEIIDEGSQNGTIVNGLFVDKRRLNAGDLIEIGSVQLFVERIDEQRLKAVRKMDGRPGVATQVGMETADLSRATVDGAEEHDQERDNLRRLQRVVMAINSTMDLEKILGIIVDHSIELTEAERGFIILAEDGELTFEVARNFAKEEVTEPEFKVSRTIAEGVLRQGEPVLAVNALDDDRFKQIHSITAMGLRSVLCLPFSTREQVVGVLYIDNRLQKGVFSRRHLRMLEALAAQAALTIDRTRMFTGLQKQTIELEAANARIKKLNRALRARMEKQQIELSKIRTDLDVKQTELELRYDYKNIVGRSAAMMTIFRRLDRIIPTELPVLVEGESGTGKELAARAIHYMGPRRKARFVSENCAALPESLLESELFGYKKGAFTGANRDKKGLFEEASGGTFFLDEVGEMSSGMQKKLLRVLQEHEFRPVGGKATQKVDVRIVSASKQNLRRLVDEGRFREDLYFRLRVLSVEMPPLRNRKADIPDLIAYFLDEHEREGNTVPDRIEPTVMDVLQAYDWPGNVRELENEVHRMIALSDQVVTLDSVSAVIRTGGHPGEEFTLDATAGTLEDQVRALEVRLIRAALRETDGNKTRAAEMLGISRFTLQRKLEKYGDELES